MFVCFLFDVLVHSGWCYDSQCYTLASLRWHSDLDDLASMGLNLEIVSFLMCSSSWGLSLVHGILEGLLMYGVMKPCDFTFVSCFVTTILLIG